TGCSSRALPGAAQSSKRFRQISQMHRDGALALGRKTRAAIRGFKPFEPDLYGWQSLILWAPTLTKKRRL
ncbi:MAG: hypothetical protein ACREE9_20780, partial [Stellaceae bacterium]